VAEPENLVLPILREMRAEMKEMRAEMTEMRAEMATKNDLAELRSEVNSLRADVASDMIDMEKRLGDRIATLNRAVMEYHSTTTGHGVLYSEIDERVRRIERHLKLDASWSTPPAAANRPHSRPCKQRRASEPARAISSLNGTRSLRDRRP
jgi:hypothetical protein